jgi:ferredoxin
MGGGNVGLITGYHAIQAGIQVVGLCEAMLECTGYRVHRDKLARLGVPIFPSHIVKQVDGESSVEIITIAEVDQNLEFLAGSEKTFHCDSLLVAVGLTPINEFQVKAEKYGMKVFSAGDASEIAEASAAMLSGKSISMQIARDLGRAVGINHQWENMIEILKSKPGKTVQSQYPSNDQLVFPVIHCHQEIPCDPCTAVCPLGLIKIPNDDIRGVPIFDSADTGCSGCRRCLAVCPGLAITLVDFRKNADSPIISIPLELDSVELFSDKGCMSVDEKGRPLGDVRFMRGFSMKGYSFTTIVEVQASKEIANQITSVVLNETQDANENILNIIHLTKENDYVCRCERVTKAEVKNLITQGCRDINEIKALTRAGMGACGGKTCTILIQQLFREMDIPDEKVISHTTRPLIIETPIGMLAGKSSQSQNP